MGLISRIRWALFDYKNQFVTDDYGQIKKLLFSSGNGGTLSDYSNNIEKVALLYTVLGRKAEYMAQCRYKLMYEESGELVQEDPMYDLINRPNFIQTYKEYIAQYAFLLSKWGVQYQNLILSLSENDPQPQNAHLINLEYEYLDIPRMRYQDMIKEEYPAKLIKYYDGEYRREIPWQELIISWDDTNRTDNFLKGTSKMKAGDQIFTNSQKRLEANNTLTTHAGGTGILSPDPRGAQMGVTSPLMPKEKEELQEEFNKYGVTAGKHKIIFSTNARQWQSIGNPMSEWDFEENTNLDYVLASNLMKMPKELFIKDATYENKKQAEIAYYCGDPLSTCQTWVDGLIKKFNYDDKGIKAVASFDHVPVMQEKKRENAKYWSEVADSIVKLREVGVDESIIEQIISEIQT